MLRKHPTLALFKDGEKADQVVSFLQLKEALTELIFTNIVEAKILSSASFFFFLHFFLLEILLFSEYAFVVLYLDV